MTFAENPYQAPTADVVEEVQMPFVAATRGRRLVAFLLDTLILTALWLLASEVVAATTGYRVPEQASSGDLVRDLLDSLVAPQAIPDYLLGFGLWLLLHGWLLHRRQQTIGKLVMGIRIAHANGAPAGFLRILVARELPLWLVPLVPFGLLLVALDPFTIFGRQRRCLHDWIAGTRVAMAR